MSGFRKVEIPREQLVLWEQRLDDAIPLDHPVRQVEYLLSSKTFAETFRDMERYYVLVEGKPPYHPRTMAGLYIYGMLNRIRSSRQLEAACYNRLDVIWLMQGQHPDHSTIADFVKTHGRHLKNLFRDVLQVAKRAELIRQGDRPIRVERLTAGALVANQHDLAFHRADDQIQVAVGVPVLEPRLGCVGPPEVAGRGVEVRRRAGVHRLAAAIEDLRR